MEFPAELPEPIQRLVKPRLALRTERLSPDDAFVGVWGGGGVVPVPSQLVRGRKPRHWVTVDCGWLETNGFGLRGCLSVYELSGSAGFVAVNDPSVALAATDGQPLFGREEWSLPGDGAFAAYLPVDFDLAEVCPGYARLYEENCPIYRKDIAAVLGGWHFDGWPDRPPELPLLSELNQRIRQAGGAGLMDEGEIYPCDPYRLALWTLRDSEPWVEVWVGPDGELEAVARIT